jgi:hypothetical protein
MIARSCGTTHPTKNLINYELRITNYELRITNYELRITPHSPIAQKAAQE